MSEDFSGYGWIKVKKFRFDPEKTWEENFEILEKHHIEEVAFLIEKVRELSRKLEEEVEKEKEKCARICERCNPRHGQEWTDQDAYDRACEDCASSIRERLSISPEWMKIHYPEG